MKSGFTSLGKGFSAGLAGMTSLFSTGNTEKEKQKDDVGIFLDFESEVSKDPLIKK